MSTIRDGYKPLPTEVTIKPSPIDGLGLFSVESIEEGIIVGLTHKSEFNFEDGYVRTPLGGFINHSNHANCRLVPRATDTGHVLYLESLRTIESGEELTTKYSIGRY